MGYDEDHFNHLAALYITEEFARHSDNKTTITMRYSSKHQTSYNLRIHSFRAWINGLTHHINLSSNFFPRRMLWECSSQRVLYQKRSSSVDDTARRGEFKARTATLLLLLSSTSINVVTSSRRAQLINLKLKCFELCGHVWLRIGAYTLVDYSSMFALLLVNDKISPVDGAAWT